MARIKTRPFLFGVLGVALLLGACSADSPTAPQQTPAPPSPPPLGFSVSLTANPTEQAVGSTTPSVITVRATREDGAPLNGSLTLTTDLGGFGTSGGPTTTTVTLVNGIGEAFFFPGDVAGIATIRVSQIGATTILATTRITIGGSVVFFLGSVSPGSGSASGGDVVTINGGGFDGPVRVTFGGTPAEVLNVSPNTITVRTPAFFGDPGTSGTPVTVSVTINLNETNAATDSLANGFVYTKGGGGGTPMFIASVTPTNGPNEGGTRVTIAGSGFSAPVQVLFLTSDGAVGLEAVVESVTATQIIVRTPAATGFGQPLQNSSVTIRVKNLTTGVETEKGAAFQYGTGILISSIAPNTGPVTGGTHVTIFGQGFDEPVQVRFGNNIQQVVSVTGTEIVVITSPINVSGCSAGGSLAVTVVNLESGASATNGSFTYTAPAAPVITGVSPNNGPAGGGTTVTITGLNFQSPVLVTFGGAPGTIQGTPTSTTIVVKTPLTTLDTGPCDDNGDGINGTVQLPKTVDIEVQNLTSECTKTLSNGFIYTPTITSCNEPAICSNGKDDDGDTFIDFGAGPTNDPGCTSPTDGSET